jgi:hypothetical protein
LAKGTFYENCNFFGDGAAASDFYGHVARSVSDYFLNEDNFGKVHAEGDHKIHVARITETDLVLDPRFHVDFNTAFATGPARPRGVAAK